MRVAGLLDANKPSLKDVRIEIYHVLRIGGPNRDGIAILAAGKLDRSAERRHFRKGEQLVHSFTPRRTWIATSDVKWWRMKVELIFSFILG